MSDFTREQVLALLAQQREACAQAFFATNHYETVGRAFGADLVRATPLVDLPEPTRQVETECENCGGSGNEGTVFAFKRCGACDPLIPAKPTEPSITVERNPWLLCCADYPHCACRRGPP